MVVQLDPSGASSAVVTTDADGIATLNLISGFGLSCHSASRAVLISALQKEGIS